MSQQLSALIVDDEKDGREMLERLISNTLSDVALIGMTDNAKEALKLIERNNPDLVFLDIQMPEQDGFWLIEKLGTKTYDIGIIFVTSYDKYVLKAMHYAAFDYLLKPVDPKELQNAVERFRMHKEHFSLIEKMEKLTEFFNKNKLRLNTHNGFILIKPEEIIFCKANGNYSTLVLADGRSQLIVMQLGEIEKKLPKNPFIRISRSAIINLDYFESFNRKTKTVILQNIIEHYELKVSSSGIKALLRL